MVQSKDILELNGYATTVVVWSRRRREYPGAKISPSFTAGQSLVSVKHNKWGWSLDRRLCPSKIFPRSPFTLNFCVYRRIETLSREQPSVGEGESECPLSFPNVAYASRANTGVGCDAPVTIRLSIGDPKCEKISRSWFWAGNVLGCNKFVTIHVAFDLFAFIFLNTPMKLKHVASSFPCESNPCSGKCACESGTGVFKTARERKILLHAAGDDTRTRTRLHLGHSSGISKKKHRVLGSFCAWKLPKCVLQNMRQLWTFLW